MLGQITSRTPSMLENQGQGMSPEAMERLMGKGFGPAQPAQPPGMSSPSTQAPMPTGGHTDFNALAQSMAGPAQAPQQRMNPMNTPWQQQGMGGGMGLGGLLGGMGGIGGMGGMDLTALLQQLQQQQQQPQPSQPSSMIPQNMWGPMGLMS